MADQKSREQGTIVTVPVALVVVGFAAVILLQLASIVGHQVLSGRQDNEAERSKDVDQSLTCYVVKVTQGAPANDVLLDCGFLQLNPKG